MLKKLFLTGLALLGVTILLITALLLWPLPETPRPGFNGDFLIRQVTVIDVVGGRRLENQSVLIRDGRIRQLDNSRDDEVARMQKTMAATSPARVIDGTGQYLIPGLWDMHTHSFKISAQYHHPLFIANGVTGVRELWGCMSEPDSYMACAEDRKRWNAALANQAGLSPRYIRHSSSAINGGNEVPAKYPSFFRAENEEQARQLVRFYANAGIDFLKTYSELLPDAYFALADEAKKHGLTLEGHRPLRVSLPEALLAGQRSFEHPRLLIYECYKAAAEYRAQPDRMTPSQRAQMVAQQDPERCAELISAMAMANTWWVPTMQVLRMNAMAGDSAFRADQRLKYIPTVIKKFFWMPDADRVAALVHPDTDRNVDADWYRLAQQQVGQAHLAGVKILAGTDAGDSYVFPGFSVHDELAELVTAGLSPAAALRSATIDAAHFSGVADDFGSVAVGKTADLLLLSADPLDNIANTRTIDGLFFNGQYFRRDDLDQLLLFAEQQASSIQTNLHLTWDAVSSPLIRVQLAD